MQCIECYHGMSCYLYDVSNQGIPQYGTGVSKPTDVIYSIIIE